LTALFRFLSGALPATGRVLGVLALLAALFALAACGALGGPGWDDGTSAVKAKIRDTRDLINPSPKIDTTRYSWDNPNQEKLSLLFSPVDAKVSALMRYVSSQDFRPNAAWIDYLLMRFPWIDGILIADATGDILERRPPVPLKRFSAPLVFESIWRETLVKTVVDYTELGPEVYFGAPNYEGTEFVGLHVVYFDPRVLFTFCPHPEQLLIVDPRAQKLWMAGTEAPPGAQELTTFPWEKMLLERSQGTVMSGGRQYTWLARYIGLDRFIYATESANATFEDKGIQLMPFFGFTK